MFNGLGSFLKHNLKLKMSYCKVILKKIEITLSLSLFIFFLQTISGQLHILIKKLISHFYFCVDSGSFIYTCMHIHTPFILYIHIIQILIHMYVHLYKKNKTNMFKSYTRTNRKKRFGVIRHMYLRTHRRQMG